MNTTETVSTERVNEMLADAKSEAARVPRDETVYDFGPEEIACALTELLNTRLNVHHEVHRCFICDEPFKADQLVLSDVNEGLGHRACFGEDREGYVKDIDTGEPLGPDDPIPAGEPYDPAEYFPARNAEPVAYRTRRADSDERWEYRREPLPNRSPIWEEEPLYAAPMPAVPDEDEDHVTDWKGLGLDVIEYRHKKTADSDQAITRVLANAPQAETAPDVVGLVELEADSNASLLMEFDVEEYVAGYEFRGDGGDYTPNDQERALLTDAIHGVVGDLLAALRQSQPVQVDEAMVRRAARGIWDAGEVGIPFEMAPASVVDSLIKQARAALTAALSVGGGE